MRVRRLRFRGIGPYPGEHEIDFDRLAVSGLFLLCGPTGTGKSTIIDAITFALYGSIEGDKDRLHSDHAADGEEPYVEMVFETPANIYRVRRTPAYERTKLRGEGTRTIGATASLVRLTSEDSLGWDAGGEGISSRPSEVGTEIIDLVGLSKEQFLQTIVLPQGEFARFLTTKPDDRQKLLQSIFNTRVYQDTQEYLVGEARRAEKSVDAAREVVVRAITSLWGDREAVPEVTDATWRDTSALRDAAAGLVAQVEHTAAELRDRVRSAKTRAEAALGRLREAERLADLLGRRERALAELAALDAHAEEHAADAARHERARAAAGLRSAFDRAGRTVAEARAAQGALADVRARAAGDVAGLDSEGLDARRDALRSHVASLREAREIEERLRTTEDRLAVLAADAATRADSVRSFQEQLGAIPGERARIQAERELATAAEARLEGRMAEVRRLEELQGVARRLSSLEAESATAHEVATRATAAAEEALTHEMTVREAWLSGIAGELAEELVDGSPCKVCGSLEHPSPASRGENSATKDDVEAARIARVAADADAATALQNVRVLAAQLAEVRAQIGDVTPDVLEEKLTAAREALAADHSAAGTSAPLDARLTELTEAERHLSAGIEEARRVIEQATAESARLSGEAEVQRATVERARGDHPSIDAALADASERLDEVEEIRTRLLAATVAERDRVTMADALASAAADAGFAGVEGARAALLPDSEFRALAARVDEVERRRTAARTTLAEPDIAALTGAETVEVDRLRVEWQEAAQAHDAENARLGAAERDLTEATRCARDLATALDAEATTAADVAALVRMAKVSRGENSRSMRLTTYVLLRRFEDVVRAANTRLATMSDGRYELRRTDEEGGQRARGQGLGLEVMDHSTGRVRSPHTLSGGETFYTSLALALGLADVVTDESGGVQLGTLFVDEGFGTLDPDTLENVMQVLQSLSLGGRAVGIVSHVTELRNQIHEQIQVSHRRDGKGSTLTVVA